MAPGCLTLLRFVWPAAGGWALGYGSMRYQLTMPKCIAFAALVPHFQTFCSLLVYLQLAEKWGGGGDVRVVKWGKSIARETGGPAAACCKLYSPFVVQSSLP